MRQPARWCSYLVRGNLATSRQYGNECRCSYSAASCWTGGTSQPVETGPIRVRLSQRTSRRNRKTSLTSLHLIVDMLLQQQLRRCIMHDVISNATRRNLAKICEFGGPRLGCRRLMCDGFLHYLAGDANIAKALAESGLACVYIYAFIL